MQTSERNGVYSSARNQDMYQNINQQQTNFNQPVFNQQQPVLIQENQQEMMPGPIPVIQSYPQNQPIYPQSQPIYPQSQPYAQPIICNPIQPNIIVVNQPLTISTHNVNFKLDPVTIICEHCMCKVTTVVFTKCNCMTCLCSCLFILCIPFMCCGKFSCDDFCKCNCCYDAYHTCPKSGATLGQLDSF